MSGSVFGSGLHVNVSRAEHVTENDDIKLKRWCSELCKWQVIVSIHTKFYYNIMCNTSPTNSTIAMQSRNEEMEGCTHRSNSDLKSKAWSSFEKSSWGAFFDLFTPEKMLWWSSRSDYHTHTCTSAHAHTWMISDQPVCLKEEVEVSVWH